MRTFSLVLSSFCLCQRLDFLQKKNNPNWIYIAIDSTKQKWGDWVQPEWLRYFGLDFGDVNNNGKTDIVS